MDGSTQRLIVVAMDGVWPVKDITDKLTDLEQKDVIAAAGKR